MVQPATSMPKRGYRPHCHWCKEDLDPNPSDFVPLTKLPGGEDLFPAAGIRVCGETCPERPEGSVVWDHGMILRAQQQGATT